MPETEPKKLTPGELDKIKEHVKWLPYGSERKYSNELLSHIAALEAELKKQTDLWDALKAGWPTVTVLFSHITKLESEVERLKVERGKLFRFVEGYALQADVCSGDEDIECWECPESETCIYAAAHAKLAEIEGDCKQCRGTGMVYFPGIGPASSGCRCPKCRGSGKDDSGGGGGE